MTQPDLTSPLSDGGQLYDRLLGDLGAAGAAYRLLEHPPEAARS